MQTIPTTAAEKCSALQQNSYFSTLSENAILELAEYTTLRSYESGEMLYWQGEACTGLYILQHGSLKLFKLSVRGRELIIRSIMEEGATFNEVPVFDGGSNAVNVAALEPSTVWMVEKNVLQQMARSNPELAQAIILNLSRNLRMLVNLVEELSFYQVTNRLARLLYQLPLNRAHTENSLHLTQDQLAARLGTVREVVARSLRELERSGAIRVNRRQIQVIDLEVLRSWSQSPDN